MFPYQTQKITLPFLDFELELFKILNIDALYDALIAKGNDHEDVKDERIPYWAELWPAALAMAQYISQQTNINKETTVLEIGAGLALPSLAIGKMVNQVTITDYLPEAIDFAEKNWNLNHTHTAKFALLDWRNPDPAFAADLVIASDVAYEKRMFAHLPKAFEVLCKPNGRVLLSEPNRGFAQDFLKNLPTTHFSIQKITLKIPMHDKTYLINILDMQRV
jgi:predicted nicotinamide N-methyase